MKTWSSKSISRYSTKTHITNRALIRLRNNPYASDKFWNDHAVCAKESSNLVFRMSLDLDSVDGLLDGSVSPPTCPTCREFVMQTLIMVRRRKR